MINMNEETFYEGGPAKSDLIINLLAGITILGLPFTFAAIVRALWLRYKITNKRITIDGGWFGKNKTQENSNMVSIQFVVMTAVLCWQTFRASSPTSSAPHRAARARHLIRSGDPGWTIQCAGNIGDTLLVARTHNLSSKQ